MNITLSTEQCDQLIQAVLSDPNLNNAEAFSLWQLLDPNATAETLETIRAMHRRTIQPLSKNTARNVKRLNPFLYLLQESHRTSQEMWRLILRNWGLR